ncbi:hypothetical protein PINS_up005192 [Pythium insidiosum]|nr:hypothetical protein PINS_up005192 [Pythium insidiosum]
MERVDVWEHAAAGGARAFTSAPAASDTDSDSRCASAASDESVTSTADTVDATDEDAMAMRRVASL